MRKIPSLIFVLLIYFLPGFINAASLSLDPAFATLYRGDAVTVSVRLDVDKLTNECVNAADVVINYPSNLEVVDVVVADSIFNLWVEKPIINKDDRIISFAGGTPNGYCGRVEGDPKLSNVLAKIILRSPGFTIGTGSADDKSVDVKFSDLSTVYLNDGFGTQVQPDFYGLRIDLDDKASSKLKNDWQQEILADNIPPEKFSAELIKGDGAYSDKYYIIFSTTDKQTGLSHYEVMEEPSSQLGAFQWGRADAPWVETASPYVLKDQTLNSTIRVKAVDKAGNERFATPLIPDESLRTVSNEGLLVIEIAVASLIVLLIVIFITWRQWRKMRIKKQIATKIFDSHQSESESDTLN